jgi:hypothetical protein
LRKLKTNLIFGWKQNALQINRLEGKNIKKILELYDGILPTSEHGVNKESKIAKEA